MHGDSRLALRRRTMVRETEAANHPPRIAWLPLMLAIVLTLALTIYPHFLTDVGGKVDYGAAAAAMWAISAGFVRGVGFVPVHPAARWLFSAPACMLGAGLAVTLFFLNR